MAETMKAAVLHGARDLRIEEVPRARITGAEQALVQVEAVGICGSDVHYWAEGRIGSKTFSQPFILGHETGGTVLEVGEAVTNVKPGDRVAVEPGYPDRTCRYCRAGHYNLCPEMTFLADPPVDGSLCEYLAWPADYLFPLPEPLDVEAGAMMEPLAVGVYANRQVRVAPGESVAVIGAGPIGLLCLQVARAAGAAQAYVVDVVPSRLDHARRLGATQVIHAGEQDALDAVRQLTEGWGVDVVLECVGLEATINQALYMVRKGGRVQLVGMSAATLAAFPAWDVILAELEIHGQFRYVNCYPPALALVQSGAVDVASMITHRWPLEQAPEAFAFVHEHRAEVIKGMVRVR
jgi:L-iditol 2-dehydrogenase